VWQRAAERWRPRGNTREVEKKKEVALLLLEERRNKNIVFLSLTEGVVISNNFFLRPVSFGGPTRLSYLHIPKNGYVWRFTSI